MRTIQRFMLAIAWTVGLAVLGIIYEQVFGELFDLATGEHAGQFTSRVEQLDLIVPLLVVILLLAVWLWAIAGAVQQERTVQRRRM